MKLKESEKIPLIGDLRIKQRSLNIYKLNDKIGNLSTRIYQNPNIVNINRVSQDESDIRRIEYNQMKQNDYLNLRTKIVNDLPHDNIGSDIDNKKRPRRKTIDYQSIRQLGIEPELSPILKNLPNKQTEFSIPIDFNKEESKLNKPLFKIDKNENLNKNVDSNFLIKIFSFQGLSKIMMYD